MPFLRNEFSKIFEDLFMKSVFTEMTHIYDYDKLFYRELLKLKGITKSLPTARELTKIKFWPISIRLKMRRCAFI